VDKLVIQLKQELIKNNQKGLALDIDETLSWTFGLWFARMQELFGNPENLTVRGLVEKYRYAKNVPYWQHTEALDWMSASRVDDKLQTELPLIEDADKYVRQVHRIIPIAAYLTVRPRTVENGTRIWLAKYGFPEAPVITRPNNIEHEKVMSGKRKSWIIYILKLWV